MLCTQFVSPDLEFSDALHLTYIFQQFIGTARQNASLLKRASVLQPGRCPDKPKYRLIYINGKVYFDVFPWITCFLGLLGHLYNWLTLYFLSLSLKFILKKQTMFRMCSPSLVFIWCFVLFSFLCDFSLVVVEPFGGCVLFLWEDKSWCTALCTV